ncbi:MAG TPA: iron ABC transporter [Erysipelotrichaceae bacterium]|nr:iron ABC transporter [Erysipelotrichaceae bacterium]HCK89430.1 iron ABC transporter [Erysipelotrichaceae bacterium]
MKYGISETGIRKRRKKEYLVLLALILIWLVLAVFLLLWGDQVYDFETVFQVIAGKEIKGASYAVRTIRIPRILIGTLAGFAFACAGNTFQKIMRNALASPDVMGITTGASAGAVFTMMVLKKSGISVSLSAMAGGILAASAILFLSRTKNFSVSRMILTGIGIQAMLQAVINFIILKTSDYNIADALRWLSGSLNGVRMNEVPVFLAIVCICTLVILAMGKDLQVLGLGEELPVTLGMHVQRSRAVLIYAAVILCAGAASVTGPLSSVAFMSGPLIQRVIRTGNNNTLQAGMTGAVLVLFSEAVGQFAFSVRYPAGVVTGIIGAPYLIYLLIRMNGKSA